MELILDCSFKLKSKKIKKIVENVKNLDKKKSLLAIVKDLDKLQKLNALDRCRILFSLAIMGLLENGFDEEKTVEILESLLEVDKKCLSPGNDEIH